MPTPGHSLGLIAYISYRPKNGWPTRQSRVAARFIFRNHHTELKLVILCPLRELSGLFERWPTQSKFIAVTFYDP